ncbi:hypothetical protein [Serratia ureilytica]|uniref:hypothetical protein n=1 Tax=Serratia TaxID=613 RepID=UPI00159BF792|nr:hypothetical protein [Serratia ureilytica]NVM49043.1 hypothetical protein [Serratia ureilytica]
MININAEIDESITDFDDDDQREAYLGYFRNNFPFLLCPTLYRRSVDLPALNWIKVKYSDHATHVFPNQQGVYIFMVAFENANLPTNSYVMYVGKAGDTDSNNTILKRFKDYVNPSGFRDRPRIKKLIQHFSDHLYYFYATIPAGQSTADVESTLADIFVPPCCQRDFSANVRSLLRGVRII